MASLFPGRRRPWAARPEALVLDALQEGHHLRMRADDVRDVQSASPISEVTLFGADCVSVSAAFFSPSHASSWSLSHHVASIPAMIAGRFCGSNKIRFNSWMSARMKSISTVPDLFWMSCFKAAMEAWLRSINPVTMAGSVSIGAGAPPAGGSLRASSASDGMKRRVRRWSAARRSAGPISPGPARPRGSRAKPVPGRRRRTASRRPCTSA